MSLTKPALNAMDLEGSALALWQEFLALWFDGAAHAAGGHPAVTFPKADLRFQQSALPQPLADAATGTPPGLGLTAVWTSPASVHPAWETVGARRQQVHLADTQFLFFLRAAGPQATSASPAKVAATAAGLLFGLLTNSHATKPLAEKGIHALRPATPVLVADTLHAVRLVTCRARLRYPVLMNPS